MKNIRAVSLGVGAALAVMSASGTALAYGPEGVFSGRYPVDGAVNVRAPFSPVHPIRGQSVIERPRPDFDPTPIPVGSFQFFPAVTAGGWYDSNIFATDTNEKSDFVWNLRPSVGLFSNWSRHALALSAIGDIGLYTEHDDENFYNGVFDAKGRIDVMRETWIKLNLGYQNLSESRSSPNDVAGSEPTKFHVYRGGVTAYHGVGSVKLTGDYDFKRHAYEDTPALGGSIVQTTRNRDQNELGGKVMYEFSPNFRPFVAGKVNSRHYDFNPLRNSDGFDVVGGSEMDFGGIVTGQAYVGYMLQDYRRFASSDVDAVKFGGDATWNITGLTSLTFEVERSIEETTAGGVTNPLAYSSFLSTGGSATVTHELMRDLLLESNVSVTRNDFEGGVTDRADDTVGVGAGARYFFNRNFHADLNYDFATRDSDVPTARFDRHMVGVRLGAQM
ncbi:MAG: outer membrane beta-barrel protein [Alphaproteobacteria bacterium]|nr:MAG: outer membrane beta-barrel protein [Alphaproteobacteria bacterium]